MLLSIIFKVIPDLVFKTLLNFANCHFVLFSQLLKNA